MINSKQKNKNTNLFTEKNKNTPTNSKVKTNFLSMKISFLIAGFIVYQIKTVRKSIVNLQLSNFKNGTNNKTNPISFKKAKMNRNSVFNKICVCSL
jgi:hypothetical protein